MNDDEERWLLSTEQEAAANLRTMLELCARGELKVSDRTSLPAAATLDAITEHLISGDFYADDAIAAFAWPLLLQAGGLAKVERGKLQLTPKGRTALTKPGPDTIRLPAGSRRPIAASGTTAFSHTFQRLFHTKTNESQSNHYLWCRIKGRTARGAPANSACGGARHGDLRGARRT